MSLTNPTAYSLLLALAGRVPAGSTPGLDRLLAEQNFPASVRGVAIFTAIPTADQVRALEDLGLAVNPMQYVALADVTGPVSAMEAAVRRGIATDVHLDERVESRNPAYRVRRSSDAPRRIEASADPVVVSMVGRSPSHRLRARRV
jgi:hypothetical protein